MFFSPIQKLFARKSQPSRRQQPARFRPQLECLEGRMLLSATIYVNAAASPGGNGSALDPFTTIQAGVNAASNGDTVQVAAGTYNELVNVNKSITILGAQSSNDPLTRSGAESIVDGNSGTTSFEVGANDVTINGFTIQGQTNVNQFGAAVYIEPGYHGTNLSYNIIQDNVVGLLLGNNSSTDQAVIAHNLFRDNTQPGASSGTDIYADQYSAGAGGVQDVLIQDNTFTNSSFVENSWGIGMSNTDTASPFSNISIVGNVFSNTGRGIYLYATNSTTVTDNTFTGNGTSQSHYAIGAFGAVNGMTIQGNTIQNFSTAIYVEDDLGTPDSPLPNSNIQVHNNNIVGNAYNIDISSDGSSSEGYSGTLDATYNWWGSTDGPAPGSFIGSVSSNPWLITPANSSSALFWHDGSGDVLMVDTSTGNYAFFLADGEVFSGTHADFHNDKLQIRSLREMGQVFLARGPLDGEIKANLTGHGNEEFHLTPFTPSNP